MFLFIAFVFLMIYLVFMIINSRLFQHFVILPEPTRLKLKRIKLFVNLFIIIVGLIILIIIR